MTVLARISSNLTDRTTILSSSEREEVHCCSQLNAYTERPNPPLVEEETPFLKHANV
jgi:hypothetical protein